MTEQFVLDKGESNFKNLNNASIEDAKNDLLQNYKNPGHPIAFSGLNTIYSHYNGILTKKIFWKSYLV